MTTTTITEYRVSSHAYAENTACAAPQSCTKAGHWDAGSGGEYTSIREARSYLDQYDAPAIRIIKVTITEEVEIV